MHRAHHPLLALTLLLAGCAAAPPALVGLDGTPCPGAVGPVPGIAPHTDAALLASARARPGEGKLCDGRTFVATAPVTLYRVWDSTHPSSEFGVWWALEPPLPPRDAYRRRYAICPGWSRLDRVTVCTLQPGSALALGTGESVACEAPDGTLARTDAVQVFLPALRTRFVACTSAAWPP